ncbi:MAG: hypothetical protein FK733_13640 [Asgard group archaeon]|nr:hypothetical protein [Asgard group archaeon]
MKRKTRKYLIFFSGLILVLGVYGLLMIGLKDFNTTSQGLRLDDSGDDSRIDHPYEYNSTIMDVGRAVGFVLWDAKGIDIIVVGVILLIASESAATIVKGIEEQCAEFRTEMCETDKFVILAQKEADEEPVEEDA